jgi:predicted DNA-binding transcriptional regulator AlpA
MDDRPRSLQAPCGAAGRMKVNAMHEEFTDRWISRQELAERYGVPVKTPAEWASRGTGPRYAKFGKHVRYRLSDVIDWEKDVSAISTATPHDERVHMSVLSALRVGRK